MSSTRRAKDDSKFHQNRYASSAEFERGLLGNLVAKRCALLGSPVDRELIWFIQFLSHQENGIAEMLNVLAKNHPKEFADGPNFTGRPAWNGREEIEARIKRICLDPASELKGSIDFPKLITALREYQASYAKSKAAAFTTALGSKVCEVLDYTSFCRGLTLMEGEARDRQIVCRSRLVRTASGRSSFCRSPTRQ